MVFTWDEVAWKLRLMGADNAARPDGDSRAQLAACDGLILLQQQRWMPPAQGPLQNLGTT